MTELNLNATPPADPTGTLATDLKEIVGEADQLARKLGHSAAEGIAATRASITEKACHAADATHQFVRGNPWTIIGIVAAVGLIVGVLLSRR